MKKDLELAYVPVIVVSRKDPAGMNIRERLIELGFEPRSEKFEGERVLELDDIKLVTTESDLVLADHMEEDFPSDLYIFASKHRSESGIPALLTHAPGNFGSRADLGGKPRTLSVTSASALKVATLSLRKFAEELGILETFDVTMEVTHHGPLFEKKPVIFVELGSNEEFWKHRKGAEAVALACLEIARNRRIWDSAIGFGGPHYAPRFTDIQLRTDIAVGHIASIYILDEIEERVVRQALERTIEKPRKVLVDWKGMKREHKERLLPILENLGVEILRTREVLK